MYNSDRLFIDWFSLHYVLQAAILFNINKLNEQQTTIILCIQNKTKQKALKVGYAIFLSLRAIFSC